MDCYAAALEDVRGTPTPEAHRVAPTGVQPASSPAAGWRTGRAAERHKHRYRSYGDWPFVHWVTSRARDRKSTRLNSSHDQISYAVFCLKKKKKKTIKNHKKDTHIPKQQVVYINK